VEAGSAIPEPYWRAAGFYVAGSRAVRIDMLERLSDLIRTRVAFRAAEGVEAPAGATGDGGFRVVPELMSVVGCSGEEFASILKSLGFRREGRRPEPGEAASGEANAAEAIAIDEIWRPGKKRGQDKVEDRKSRQKMRAKAPRREPPRRAEAAERKKLEDSPFAALAALKGRPSPRQQQGS
jgi:ATP-dependent RNA helicase SUPV3L1/SUV3